MSVAAQPALSSTRIAVRGDLLDFSAQPAWGEVESSAVRYRPDHWLLIEDGRIAGVQAADPDPGWVRHDHAGRLVMPGFIDTHVHMPQLDVIGSYGAALIDWLETHTFPAEALYADPQRSAARPGLGSSSIRCSLRADVAQAERDCIDLIARWHGAPGRPRSRNLKAAKALGIAIPQSVLLRADEAIE